MALDFCPNLSRHSGRRATITFSAHAWRTHTYNFLLQETQRRVPTSSRPDVLNATLSARVREIRLALTFTVFSVVKPVPSRATHIPMPTSKRLSHGTRTHFSNISRTQRNISPVPRWLSVDWRRTRTGTIWSSTWRRRPSRGFHDYCIHKIRRSGLYSRLDKCSRGRRNLGQVFFDQPKYKIQTTILLFILLHQAFSSVTWFIPDSMTITVNYPYMFSSELCKFLARWVNCVFDFHLNQHPAVFQHRPMFSCTSAQAHLSSSKINMSLLLWSFG